MSSSEGELEAEVEAEAESGGGPLRSQRKAASRARRSPYSTAKDNRLRVAVQTNNVEAVSRLLAAGCSAKAADEHGRSLLHVAACSGYRDVVSLLLAAGADPNARDSLGNTPLHLAACTNHAHVVLLLLRAGTDVSSLDGHGRDPIQLAQSKLKIVKLRRTGDAFDARKLRDEIKSIVDAMLHYLQARKADASEIEALAKRLEGVSTEEQVDDEISRLMKNLDELDVSPRDCDQLGERSRVRDPI